MKSKKIIQEIKIEVYYYFAKYIDSNQGLHLHKILIPPRLSFENFEKKHEPHKKMPTILQNLISHDFIIRGVCQKV